MKSFQHIPAVHTLQADERFLETMATHNISKKTLTHWIKEQIDLVRTRMINNEFSNKTLYQDYITNLIIISINEKINEFEQNNLQNVVNATGVILHTNLGRARLSDEAIKQISNTATNYSTLEYDITTGKRGSKHDLVEEYIKELTGAEAAMVVNNNAAAVYLTLKAMAYKQEVIVIGGSLRISEITKESEAYLVDVGTTNKTHLYDYEQAINEATALLLKVHKSNFKIVGFYDEVDTNDLLKLSKENNIPIYKDLGSGTLFDFKQYNIDRKSVVQ